MFFKISLILSLLTMQSMVFAVDFSKYQMTQEKLEQKVHFDEIKNFLTLKTNTGQTLYLVYTGDLPEKNWEKFLNFYQTISNWKSMQIKSIQAMFQENSLDVLIMLSAFKDDGRDYLAFVPNGIAFYLLDKQIQYDFRILKETQSYKFKGVLENEPAFLEKFRIYIQEKNPEEFLKKQQSKKEKPEEVKVVIKEQPDSISYKQSLKLFVGSGTLLGLGYSKVFWNWFEPVITTGAIFYDTTDAYGSKLNKFAVPLGLKLNLNIYHSIFFQPYFTAGCQYNLSLKNYQSRFFAYAGIGEIMFRYIFVEFTYMYSSRWEGFVFGLGFNYPFY